MRISPRLTSCILLLLASSCAIQVPPSGGDQDILPPQLKKATPENFSTNFSGKEISLQFDEYISLKDLNSQFVVSPPLKNTPEIKVSKKYLHIRLKDTLAANATYTMNFGNAIVDIHEGNPVEDFQYVFSTGNELDSLTVSGKVETALDKKTEKGIYVMLYRNPDDSVPIKSLPDYFSKTTENGNFEIRNVAVGNYRIFALKDNNTNFLFDNQEEAIGFSDKPVEAGSIKNDLELFTGKKKQQLLKATGDEPGRITIAYTQPLQNEKLLFLSDTSALQLYSLNFFPEHDTIRIWYRNQLSDSLNFIINHREGIDTLQIRLKLLDTKGKLKTYVTLYSQYPTGTEQPLALNAPLQLAFNHPILRSNLSVISLTEDSVPMNGAKIFFADSLQTKLTIDFPKKENSKYRIQIPEGALEDIFGIKNDTLNYLFRTKSISDFGTVTVKLTSLQPGKNYILQLIDEKEVIYRQSYVKEDSSVYYDYLDPKIYRLKIIEDLNQNEEWDTGDYLKHIQPEPVFYYQENLTVRANWDVEVKWNLEN